MSTIYYFLIYPLEIYHAAAATLVIVIRVGYSHRYNQDASSHRDCYFDQKDYNSMFCRDFPRKQRQSSVTSEETTNFRWWISFSHVAIVAARAIKADLVIVLPLVHLSYIRYQKLAGTGCDLRGVVEVQHNRFWFSRQGGIWEIPSEARKFKNPFRASHSFESIQKYACPKTRECLGC